MVLTLYGYPISTCSKRVAVVLHEKQVPFKFVTIDLATGEQKAPVHLEKHPFGETPYIVDDDGFVLYESRAIARYIEEKYAGQGTTLIPRDLKAKGLFEQAVSIETANFDPYASKAAQEKISKPAMTGLAPDEAYFESQIKELAKNLDVYDKILSKQKYLAGDEITLADLFHLPYAEALPYTGTKVIEERPNVARWLSDLRARPSWQAVKDGVSGTA
ncbi:hypothetical protein EST38_g10678 [Candolleomyces aberdarensis]|uniref:glutathione transferase n=1 Tax=Candolleomyces aberdarensis TaxID=2316362 RepID=A0A4Q2D8D0_9AGAR|nr:hypothetical protein EST38_g10678 [Candolleomyces aberdarensis]